jgi:putative inorganic carbon (hco3(-)) transporter
MIMRIPKEWQPGSDATSILARALLWCALPLVLITLGIILTFANLDFLYNPDLPALVGAGIVASILVPAILLIFLKHPVWAFYLGTLWMFLPDGIMPSNLQSIMNRGLAAACLILFGLDRWIRPQRIEWNPALTMLVCFLFWAGASLSWSSRPEDGLVPLVAYIVRVGFCLFLGINMIRSKSDVDHLMDAVCISGWIVVIVSVVYLLTAGYQFGSRLRVFDINENHLGIVLLVGLTGAIWQTVSRDGSMRKPIWVVLAILYLLTTLMMTVLSGSRGSILSIALTCMSFLCVKRVRAWGLLGILVCGIGAIVFPMAYANILERFIGSVKDPALGGREDIWPAALELIADHLPIGVGIGNSAVALKLYMNVWSEDGIPFHNPILSVLGEMGIPGLIFYLGAPIYACCRFMRSYIATDEEWIRRYAVIVGPVFIGFMASWFKGGGMEASFLYFFMLAMLMIPATIQAAEKRDNGAPAPDVSKPSLGDTA